MAYFLGVLLLPGDLRLRDGMVIMTKYKCKITKVVRSFDQSQSIRSQPFVIQQSIDERDYKLIEINPSITISDLSEYSDFVRQSISLDFRRFSGRTKIKL